MNKELLKLVVLDMHRIVRQAVIVPRDYSFENTLNYVLVGLRRAGKSTLMYKIAQDLIASGVSWNQILYINFEDERLSDFTIADFNDIVELASEMSEEKTYFFFDEVQNVSGWEKFARRLADAKEYVRITGSNAQMLSAEISTTLGGRYMVRHIAPYNFREYLSARSFDISPISDMDTHQRGSLQKMVREYLDFGGFPEAVALTDKRDYLSSVYNKVLLGDVVSRNRIRNPQGIKIMMKKIAETVTDSVSFSKLHNTLKSIGVSVGKDAVIDYVSQVQNAYLLFAVRNYYARFVERETAPKYYFSDNGLLNLFLFDKPTSLLENLVAISLRHRFGEDDVYFVKSEKTGIDIDFFVPSIGLAVQVAFTIEGTARAREVGNLLRFRSLSDEARSLVIVTYNDPCADADGVQVVSLARWLLE